MKHRLADLTNLIKLPLWLGLAALIGLSYLATAQFIYGYGGFPLDDAWIHQTYARNIGQRGEFAFIPGLPSAGSTAPLWTLLLSLGYALGLPFKGWAYGLGILFLGLSGFSMARLGQQLFPRELWLGPLVGLVLVLEWHLGWATVSGMETILFIWLCIFIVERYVKLKKTYHYQGLFLLGLLGGVLTLVRPEGLGLAGLIGLEIGVTTLWHSSALSRPGRTLFSRWLIFGLGLLLPLLPYLAFNYSVTGLLLPNTFYAKQQEYGLWLKEQFTPPQELTFRLQVFLTPFIGMQVLLIPGLLKGLATIWRERNTILGMIVVWWLSYATLYAIRLPVTYQHGRYQIPVIPWVLLLGIWGTAMLLKPGHRQLWPRVLSRVWLASSVLVTALFLLLGIQAYARDVRIIETEMVVVAHWLREKTGPDAIIAAHDIGAIGYFTERRLVDLAGLITPEVIPFIRDETALLDFALRQGAEYLVTFPSWYPRMTQSLPQVYTTNSPWAIEAGSEDNMAVYSLQ